MFGEIVHHGLAVEYFEAFDVCVFRLCGTILPEDVVAASLKEAIAHPTSTRLWDLSAASFDGWSEARLRSLVRSLAPTVLCASGMRVALVSANAEGARICLFLKRLVGAQGFPVTVEAFSSRTLALDWLGVMHVPVGHVAPATWT